MNMIEHHSAQLGAEPGGAGMGKGKGSPALQAALQAVKDFGAAAPDGVPVGSEHSVYFAQFQQGDLYAEPVLLQAEGFQTQYWPKRRFSGEADQQVYLDGLLTGFAESDGDKPIPDLYLHSKAFEKGWNEGADYRACVASLEMIGRNGWRGCILVEDKSWPAVWADDIGALVDDGLEGCLDETWTATRGTVAGQIITLLGSHPKFRDIHSKAIAQHLRHAATYLKPEVAAHDMDPALALYDRAKAVYDRLDSLLVLTTDAVAAPGVAAQVDDLGLALDHAEDELAPYLAERARRLAREKQEPVRADGPVAGDLVEAPDQDEYGVDEPEHDCGEDVCVCADQDGRAAA